MRTSALYQNILGAYGSYPKHPKSLKPNFHCLNSCWKSQKLKLFPGSSLRKSRYDYSNMCMDWLPCVLRAAPTNLNDIDLRSVGYKHCEALLDLPNNLNDCNSLDELPAKGHSENDIAKDTRKAATSFDTFLKFLLLFGLLTVQGSQQAVAGSDFAGGLQSTSFFEDLGDISTGFASAFLLIFFSELGDKTFFIAALLAARNSAGVVFVGTFGALAGMTIISVVLGRTFHYVDELLPFRFGETDLPIDDIAAVCLLVYFGVSTLLDASSSDGLKTEDEQKEAEIAVSKFSGDGAGIISAASTIISTFVLVFVAEWGDKSFFSTIALAAASSPLGVIGGALAGHGVATLIAVLGGSLLGTLLSEKRPQGNAVPHHQTTP